MYHPNPLPVLLLVLVLVLVLVVLTTETAEVLDMGQGKSSCGSAKCVVSDWLPTSNVSRTIISPNQVRLFSSSSSSQSFTVCLFLTVSSMFNWPAVNFDSAVCAIDSSARVLHLYR